MDESALATVIKDALIAARDNTTDPEVAAENIGHAIASGIKQMVQHATVTYVPATLTAPPSGGPVTGAGTSIATLS